MQTLPQAEAGWGCGCRWGGGGDRTGAFAIPFLLLAGGRGQARGLMGRMAPALPRITRGAGVLLALLGLLVAVGTGPALAAGSATLT